MGSSISKSSKAKSNVQSFSDKFEKYQITKIISLTSDTKQFQLKLNNPNQILDLPVASFYKIKGPNNILRPYTPVINKDEIGFFNFIIKKYSNGIVSSYIHSKQCGDNIEIIGPFFKFQYIPNIKKNIGTGLTPMLQIINEILNNPNDLTEITFIYANHTENDIIYRDKLDELCNNHNNFNIIYVISNCINQNNWNGYIGHISNKILNESLPKPNNDNLILVCGPPSFMQTISGDKTVDKTQGKVEGILKDLGYNENMINEVFLRGYIEDKDIDIFLSKLETLSASHLHRYMFSYYDIEYKLLPLSRHLLLKRTETTSIITNLCNEKNYLLEKDINSNNINNSKLINNNDLNNDFIPKINLTLINRNDCITNTYLFQEDFGKMRCRQDSLVLGNVDKFLDTLSMKKTGNIWESNGLRIELFGDIFVSIMSLKTVDYEDNILIVEISSVCTENVATKASEKIKSMAISMAPLLTIID